MRINRHNYESWFLDYGEGRLSQEEKDMVMDFLVQHPDLKDEFELLDTELALNADSLNYEKQDELKKNLPAKYADDELVIAYLSEDLNKLQKQRVEARLEVDDSFRKLFKKYKELELTPNKALSLNDDLSVRGPVDDNLDDYLIAFHENDLSLVEMRLWENYLKANPETEIEWKAFEKIKLVPDLNILFPDKRALKKSSPVIIQLYKWTAVAAAAAILIFFLLPTAQKDPSIEDVVMEIPTGPIYPQPAKPFNENALVEESIEYEEQPAVKNVIETKEKQERIPQIINLVEPAIENIDLAEETGKRVKNEFQEEIIEEDPEVPQPVVSGVFEELDEGIALIDEVDSLDSRTLDVVSEPIAQNSNSSKDNTLHILDVVEAAGEKSGLYTFTSNVKEDSQYNEFSIGIGKFKLSRKARKKTRS